MIVRKKEKIVIAFILTIKKAPNVISIRSLYQMVIF